ncbi:MAG: carboxypeptidase regulatory-like domain-containing protein, partial [Planctomycetota bacterium]
TPSVAESVARVELHRKVVDEVLALEEPYRSSITLRYFDGLSPKEIARRLGTPVRTVKTRLHRALERLRGRLDRLHAGDRETWCLALLPLAGVALESGGAGGLTAGALAMKKKLAIAAALVCVAATLTLTFHATRGQAEPPGRAAGRAAGTADRDDPDAPGEAGEADARGKRNNQEEKHGFRTPGSSPGANRGVLPGHEKEKKRVHRLAEASADPEQAGLRVLVVDEHGGPLAGAGVYVTISRNNVGMSGGNGTTDAAGQVSFPNLDAEEFLAASVAVGSLWRNVNASVLGFELVKGRVTEIRLVVPDGVVLEGDVRHVEKGPLERASVSLQRTVEAYTDRVYGRTDASGHYRMDGVPPGTFDVELSAEALAFNECKQGQLVVEAPGPVRKDFVLGRLSLHGYVLDARTKRPVVGANVSVWQPYTGTTTDEHGRYRLTGLPAGRYSVSASKDGYATGRAYRVEVNTGLARRQDFALETAAIVHLHFVDAQGHPVTGQFKFKVEGGEGRSFSTTVTAEGEGRLRYARLLPGPYTLTVRRAGWRDASQQVDIKPGENTVRFEVERTRPKRVSLHGTIRDATTGRPIAGARIWIQSGWRHTSSDAQGRYAFEDLWPGRWQLFVRKDCFAEVVRQGVAIEKGKATKIDLELQPAATLLLRVLDWEGRAVRGELMLIFSPLDRGRRASADVETDRGGELAYRRVLPGRYRLRVSGPQRGRATIEVEIMAGKNFAEVRLEQK